MRTFRNRRWTWIAVCGAALLSGLLAWWLWQRAQAEDAYWQARYQQIANQRDYQASTLPCALRFARGNVSQVSAYADLDWGGSAPELASGRDDTEGETWAEFYRRDTLVDAGGLVGLLASERHPLVGQRLRYLYTESRPTATFAGELQPVWQGEQDGWLLSIRWLATPFRPARVEPPDPLVAVAPLPTRWSELDPHPLEQRSEALRGPWTWIAADDRPDLREAYQRERRRSTEYLRDQPDAQRRAQERWENIHSHFHLVEALRLVAPGQVVALRRFGRIIGGNTINRSVGEIGAMMDSVRCTP